ncbi:penicillin-binding protein activator [Psychromonas arctica]|uniref:penicillin-binding protein activator n=1 Tax=Psychromonas arctica TaxID=168275 RepID=UPI0006855FC3|nr:penicillin-binding protein activator [Psychromonas arctica]
MNTAILSKRALYFPLMVLSMLFVSACSVIEPDKSTAPTLFTEFNESAQYLLKQADKLDEADNTPWQLAAVQALTQENKFVLADSVIEHLQKKTLTTQQKNHLLLLIAENDYALNQFDKTDAILKKITQNVLSAPANLHYLKIKVDLQVSNKEHQAASDTLLELTPLLTTEQDKQTYNDLLLNELSLLDPSILNKFKKVTSSAEIFSNKALVTDATGENTNAQTALVTQQKEMFVHGWYTLASVYQRYQLRNNQLLQAVDAWKLAYSSHPVINYMPTQLTNIEEAIPYKANKIAVLLPLSGRFKKPAEAIQYGISHAFYNQLALKKQLDNEQDQFKESDPTIAYTPEIIIPSELKSPPADLLFIDTTKHTAQSIADQLHAQSIDFVIGPLVKSNIDQLLPLITDIPVLALNRFQEDDESAAASSSIHYAFPLSPENEAEQAAEMIFKNNHKKPLLLAPKSKFGERVAAAFEARWIALNEEQQAESDYGVEGYPAETHYFAAKSEYPKLISTALQTDKSQQRINQMRSVVGYGIKSELRSRRDVDAIYIISSRSELILLKPFIAVTVSPFAKSIPLYASSRSHASDLANIQNKELSELTFSDIAFLMDDDSQMNKNIQAIWPHQSFRTLRLFALGYDSYNLIEQLKQMQVIEGYKYQGLVGELTLDQRNTLRSKLHWAKYQEGELVEVTSSVSGQ